MNAYVKNILWWFTALAVSFAVVASIPTKHEFATSQIREGAQFEYVRFVRDGGESALVVVLRLSEATVVDYLARGVVVVLESDDGTGNWRERARRKPAGRIEFKLPGNEPVMLLRARYL